MTLIDLDRAAPPGPAAGRRPPPRRYRHAGLLLSVILALTLGGAAPTAGFFWRYLGEAGPVDGAETPVQLAGGNLYTVSSAGVERELTAWALEPAPRRLWSSPVPIGTGYDAAGGLFGRVTVRQAGDVVLMSEGVSTTAIDARTGATRWTKPVTVTLFGSRRIGVVLDRVFRPGTEYDQTSGDPGPLYFSATGVPHTEAPVRTEIRGVYLASGETAWTVAPGGSVAVDAAPGTPPAVVITSSERLALVAGETGETLRAVGLPARGGSGPSAGAVVGDLALVGYVGPAVQVAYDVRTLRRLWERGLAGLPGEATDCAGLVCAGVRNSVVVLDPATGGPAWPISGAVNLAARAGAVLETRSDTDAPVRLADRLTGRTLVDLAGWDEALAGGPESALLLRRSDAAGGQTFAVVPPGAGALTRLGTVDVDGAQCTADERNVVCRDGTGLRVWAYRI